MTDLTALSNVNILVGISVSEPTDEELIELGLSELHLRHAFIELVRHILARGWSVAYGGDLRTSGYTEALFDLVRTYNPRDLSGPERIRAYLAWPNWTWLRPEDRASIANVATLIEVPAPAGAPATLPKIPERDPEDLLCNSKALTDMRSRMTSDIRARVVLGGRTSGQQGLLPGVIEEASIALRAGIPLFVAGGFGGCGKILVRALDGDEPRELTPEYQMAKTPRYKELFDAATAGGITPDYQELRQYLIGVRMEGLSNGLDMAENRRLAVTDDVDEVVALVLRGLRRTAEPESPNATGGNTGG